MQLPWFWPEQLWDLLKNYPRMSVNVRKSRTDRKIFQSTRLIIQRLVY
jgi:hypothetical protein